MMEPSELREYWAELHRRVEALDRSLDGLEAQVREKPEDDTVRALATLREVTAQVHVLAIGGAEREQRERAAVDGEWRVAISKALGLKGDDRASTLPLPVLAQKVAAARDVALEEAAGIAVDEAKKWGDVAPRTTAMSVAERIRAIQSSPVAVVRKDEVREVLVDLGATIKVDERWTEGSRAEHRILNIIARRLGVDLDATGAQPTNDTGPRGCDCTGAPHPEEPGCPGVPLRESTAAPETCPKCGHAPHWQQAEKGLSAHSYCSWRSSWSSPDCGCDYIPPRPAEQSEALRSLRPGEVGCCDLYGTPHDTCRHAPERGSQEHGSTIASRWAQVQPLSAEAAAAIVRPAGSGGLDWDTCACGKPRTAHDKFNGRIYANIPGAPSGMQRIMCHGFRPAEPSVCECGMRYAAHNAQRQVWTKQDGRDVCLCSGFRPAGREG